MNAYTTTSARNTATATTGFARLFRALRTEVRRAIEVVGASYRNGPMRPL